MNHLSGNGWQQPVYSDHLGQLLQRLAADFQQRTLVKCRQRGHHRIRGTHFTIASYLDEVGQPLGELALRVGITQQATGKLLRDLEFGGYACSAAADQDRRSRIIRLTSAGVALQHDLAAILQEIRGEYCELLGVQQLQGLEQQLQHSVAALLETQLHDPLDIEQTPDELTDPHP